MANQISIIIQAQDNASKKIRGVGDAVKATGDESDTAGGKVFRLNDHLGALAGIAGGAGAATYGLMHFMARSVEEANRLDSALMGLSSIAGAYDQDVTKAKKASQDLASDGLMGVADSATGLKNLLASGFNLDESITLMKRFKDSAAFGRQGSLSFGQAIASATEGIKNGNSILVDNAGVTKNLSRMLEDAGYSAQDLSKASEDGGIRQAIFNGILKETNAQTGDAARLADSAAGQQEKWNAQTTELYQRIGTSLQPALVGLLEVATPIIETIADWVAKNPELASGIVITATALFGFIGTAAGVGLAIAGLGETFKLFRVVSGAAIDGVGGTFDGLKGKVGTPIVMPALVIGAAILAIQQVWQAYQDTMNAIKQGEEQLKQSQSVTKTIQDKYYAAKASGNKAETDKYFKMYMNALDSDISILNQQANNKPKSLWNWGFLNQHAAGTNSSPGGWSLINEHGPEIVNLPQGSSVTPAYRSRNALGSGSGVNIENLTYHVYNQMDEKRALRDLGFQLELAS